MGSLTGLLRICTMFNYYPLGTHVTTKACPLFKQTLTAKGVSCIQLFKKFIIFKCVPVCVCEQECKCLQRAEVLDPPEAEVIVAMN